jgi:formate--tetrahydrofolate ligase
LRPDAAVLVATVRALKYNGGVQKSALCEENLDALKIGIANLGAHIENIQKYKIPCVVAINAFATDTRAELEFVADYCKSRGVPFALSRVFTDGGAGGTELAEITAKAADKGGNFTPLYADALSIKEKIHETVTKIYGGNGAVYSPAAEKSIARLTALGFASMPVCVAKTQYSLSDDPALLGRPTGFTVTVREVRVSAGAGFIVALTGEVMTMPGLPKIPAANGLDVRGDGEITGLF